MHCSSAYPTPVHEANLAAIKTIRDLTGCSVGWSDHTVSKEVLFRAVHKWGASIVEFHIDLDGSGDTTMKDIFASGYFDLIAGCWNTTGLKECSKQCGSFDKLNEQFVERT